MGKQGSPVQFGFHIQAVMGRVLTTVFNDDWGPGQRHVTELSASDYQIV